MCQFFAKRAKWTLICHWIVHLFCLIAIANLLNLVPYNNRSGQEIQVRNESQWETRSRTELYYAENSTFARELAQKERVLCWVMTGPANHERKAKHVKATWGKRCNILLFMSSESDDSLPTVKLPLVEGRETLWGKTKEGFRYVWEKYRHEADWFMKADDDSYVILENLRYLLSAYNSSEPLYFGHKFKQFVQKGYMQGGSGYTLSKEALKRFVENGLTDSKICRADPGGAEDVEIGLCMERLGVNGVDTRDSYGRHRFLPFTPGAHINAEPVSKNWWLWDYTYYPIKRGFKCCSDTAVGFHYVSPQDMYTFDYLIYHVQPYGIVNYRSRVQRYPAYPPDDGLTATPFPGPSEEDNQKYEQFREEQRLLDVKIEEMNKKAKELDDNEQLRLKEIEQRKTSKLE